MVMCYLHICTSFNVYQYECVCIATFHGIEKKVWWLIDKYTCWHGLSEVIAPIQSDASYVQGHSCWPVNLRCQRCWFWPRQGCCRAACWRTKRQTQAYTYWGLCWPACWSEGLCYWEPGEICIIYKFSNLERWWQSWLNLILIGAWARILQSRGFHTS